MKNIVPFSKFQFRVMFIKSPGAFLLSLFLTLLHGVCCLGPILSISFIPFFFITGGAAYKLYLTAFQIAFTAFLLGGLGWRFSGGNRRAQGWWEGFFSVAPLLVSLAGLAIAWLEPFKTEQQRLAEQQFIFFKTNRTARIQMTEAYEPEKLRVDLRQVAGVRKVRFQDNGRLVEIHFDTTQSSEALISTELDEKGYCFKSL